MTGRILVRSTWMTVMTMIGTAACLAVVLLQQGLFALLAGQVRLAAVHLGVAALLGWAVRLLCRYRNDLIDDPAEDPSGLLTWRRAERDFARAFDRR